MQELVCIFKKLFVVVMTGHVHTEPIARYHKAGIRHAGTRVYDSAFLKNVNHSVVEGSKGICVTAHDNTESIFKKLAVFDYLLSDLIV